ncbi:medium-chain acyl-CoA ligase ACSF2, mitochondrial-like [Pecten maximus]|uniref:medium-chain acyl-CoA ligase ACSF2, mitochondrial-like n=1 Tax=Pecten maximus TaxID=6579 RepID=UPI001458C41C|nr:medium-chain acyl-CoA ligase ACSF2, mitochondrial-like [Pecten maximus]
MTAVSNLSYLHTPPVRPYIYTTVTQIARENACLRPNQEILIIRELDGSRYSLTNARLYQQAEQLARYLVTQGVKRGDTVGLVGPNSLEKAIGSLGIMLAGAIIWNANINLKTAQDVMAQIQLLKAKVMLVDCGKDNCFLPPVKAMLDQRNAQTNSTDIKVTYLRKTDVNMSETLEHIQSLQLYQIELPTIYPEDDAILLPTSGSTGKSKIVRHSHFTFINCPSSKYSVCDKLPQDNFNEKVFSWMSKIVPYIIVQGQPSVMLGSDITMNSANAGFIWQILKEEKCTDAWLQPFVINDLLDLPKYVTEDGFRVRSIVVTGQMIDNFYMGVIGRFCQKLMIIYSSVECCPLAVYSSTDVNEPLKAGDVGRPIPGVEIRIVDQQDVPIEKGLIGKIQVRSPYAMKKYDGNPELTKKVFTEEKWYRTGDLGKMSRNGNLVIVGREADVISRGCKDIYPGTLESLLREMASIKDVCVVPVPDKRLLEEVCVCFVSSGQLNPEDVKKFFEQKLFKEQTQNNLSEIPTYFLQFQAFPEVGNGKFDRKTIRCDAIARLGLTKTHASMNK